MAINQKQNDYINHIFENRQLNNQIEMDRRRREVFKSIPEIAELNDKAASLAADAARRSLNGDASAMDNLDKTLTDITRQREALLLAGGFSADYLDDIYHCQICKDTGYINGISCKCREDEISKMLYNNNQLSELLGEESFSSINYDYYSNDIVDEATNKTALENIRDVVDDCKKFIENFDNKDDNLFIYGKAGLGKTYLINCITRELINKSYNVIYLSAIHFFELMAKQTFQKNNLTTYNEISMNDIFECDLLVIDDLGTEMNNKFVDSSLFNCINERLLRKKSMIISSNLSLEDLQLNYDDRIFSRIIGEFTLHHIIGEDIRNKKINY